MRNRQALDSLAIRPRMLRNVSNQTADASGHLLAENVGDIPVPAWDRAICDR